MQLPAGLLPDALMWRVQTFLRTPTAGIIHEATLPWLFIKMQAVGNFVDERYGFYNYQLLEE